ncbi:acyltransferase family protein [Bacteroides faecium]|uniref:Acyltransferase family protein n=1 Tax=Bacteroides faecium TaxID=2715212 RepID=A0A6H0KQ72_9BACE|nr:acyltransferase family protein [Bacteroides faecium]QIU95512.1 acyltransferase family protein [Bacteroides faecium]
MAQVRKDYIDIAKGFTILWVVWMHMELPSYLFASVQMPVFFFLSGALWSEKKELMPLLRSRLRTLLVPAVYFTILSFVLIGWRDDKDFASASFLMKLDLAQKGSITWFLVALFLFNMIQYVIDKYRLKWYYLGWAILVYPIGSYFYAKGYYTVVPLFPLAHILVFQIYFVLGVYIGRNTLNMIEYPLINGRNLVIFSIITIVLVHLIPWQTGFLKHISFFV